MLLPTGRLRKEFFFFLRLSTVIGIHVQMMLTDLTQYNANFCIVTAI